MRRRLTVEDQRSVVEANVRAYAKVWRRYEQKHGEIFNPIEQQRLRTSLERAIGEIRSGGRSALDFGAGTGNVTAHLRELGFEVTAADVSPHLLEALAQSHPDVRTVRIAGLDLAELPGESFDLVTAYSVLHHVPEYLPMLDELVRVTRPGGILYIDHEWNDDHWSEAPELVEFRRALDEHARSRPGWWNPARRRWQRYLIPRKYAYRAKLRWRPQLIFDEGDIHVFSGDHIEWDEVERRLAAAGADAVFREDHLHYDAAYPLEVYEQHRERASDMRTLAARRRGAATPA